MADDNTPPADDAREALIESLDDFMEDWYDRWAGPGETWVVRDMATSIVEEWLPKVRSHGTVTDAEVTAFARAYEREMQKHAQHLRAIRPALEAAREGRNA